MFEMLVNPREAEKKPYRLFFIGLLYSSLSLFLVNWIFLRDAVFAHHASLLIIIFSVMFSIPFIYSLFKLAEIEEITAGENKTLFKEHFWEVIALLYLFLGFVVAFAFWYIVLPQDTVKLDFGTQIEKYCSINMPENVDGCLKDYGIIDSKITGRVIGGNDLTNVFINNIYVLIFILIFSLAFGAGAIFILAWNASVIAAAIGMLVKNASAQFLSSFGAYMLHGLPEIAAYFVAALAGGILSVAIIRGDLKGKRFRNIFLDFITLIIIAVVILYIAALIEIYISPALF